MNYLPIIRKLFTLTGLPSDGDLEDLSNSAQKHLLTPNKDALCAKIFRPEYLNKNLPWENKKEEALPLLKKLGCVLEVRAKNFIYDYALLLGGWTDYVVSRLEFLVSEWRRGVRFKTLVFLTGERYLVPEIEPLAAQCATETEMMLEIFHTLQMPQEMKNSVVEVVHTPSHKKERPHTDDTILEWVKRQPEAGSCLAVTDQPFLLYQHSSLCTLLPSSFDVETIGAEAKKETPLVIFLDSIARFLYQEIRRTQVLDKPS